MTETITNSGWQVYESFPEVAPINDLKPHEIGNFECWCHPCTDGDVIVHNAMDGREAFERLERKPS